MFRMAIHKQNGCKCGANQGTCLWKQMKHYLWLEMEISFGLCQNWTWDWSARNLRLICWLISKGRFRWLCVMTYKRNYRESHSFPCDCFSLSKTKVDAEQKAIEDKPQAAFDKFTHRILWMLLTVAQLLLRLLLQVTEDGVWKVQL
jgi:hypothetical protein